MALMLTALTKIMGVKYSFQNSVRLVAYNDVSQSSIIKPQISLYEAGVTL